MNHWPQLSKPLDNPNKRVVLSLGAGVQSSVLAFMAGRGDIEGAMPEVAIFSDTGGEMARTYDYIEYIASQVPFPVVRVKKEGPSLGDLSVAVVEGRTSYKGSPIPPFYLLDGADRSMNPKQCSKEFKTRPVARAIAAMIGLEPGQRGPSEPVVELWLGMSRDEIVRVGTNERKWIHNRHPLVELNMTRRDCVRWAEERQYRLPRKSSCYFCPFRDNQAWLDMAENDPEDFEKACQFDEKVRPGWPGMTGQLFIHRSFRPLREVPLDAPDPQRDFFHDCDSCGV